MRSRGTRAAPFELAPWLIAAAYAVAFSAFGLLRYTGYHASCDDGLFLQTIASAFHGFSNTLEDASHFAYHFSPILYLLVPVVWLWKSALVLMLVQAIACALTIPAVYAVARRRMNATEATLVAIVAALYPALGGVTLTDFHENAFAPAATAWLLWAIDTRKLPIAIAFAAICLSIKEDQAVVLAAVGAAGAVYFRQRGESRWMWFSLGLALASLATLGLYLWVVRPAVTWIGYPSLRDFYGGFNLLPLLHGLFAFEKLAYLGWVVIPLVGLCLLSRCMLLAVPGLLECLLARQPIAYTIGSHHAAIWIGYVLIAFAIGASRLRSGERTLLVMLPAAIAFNLFVLVVAAPKLWAENLSPYAQAGDLAGVLSNLPPGAAVTSFCPIFAHLGSNPRATVFVGSPTAFVAIDPARDSPGWDASETRFVRKAGYRPVAQSGSIVLYAKP